MEVLNWSCVLAQNDLTNMENPFCRQGGSLFGCLGVFPFKNKLTCPQWSCNNCQWINWLHHLHYGFFGCHSVCVKGLRVFFTVFLVLKLPSALFFYMFLILHKQGWWSCWSSIYCVGSKFSNSHVRHSWTGPTFATFASTILWKLANISPIANIYNLINIDSNRPDVQLSWCAI